MASIGHVNGFPTKSYLLVNCVGLARSFREFQIHPKSGCRFFKSSRPFWILIEFGLIITLYKQTTLDLSGNLVAPTGLDISILGHDILCLAVTWHTLTRVCVRARQSPDEAPKPLHMRLLKFLCGHVGLFILVSVVAALGKDRSNEGFWRAEVSVRLRWFISIVPATSKGRNRNDRITSLLQLNTICLHI